MKLTVVSVLLLVCLSAMVCLSEAGRKTDEQRKADREARRLRKKKNKNKRDSSGSTDLESSSFEEEEETEGDNGRACLTKPKKILRLHLAALASRQNNSAVFIAPSISGRAHLPPSGPVGTRPNHGGHCLEKVHKMVDETRYPPVIRYVECVCLDCREEGVVTKFCDSIQYELDVLQLNEDRPCLDGMMQYEKAKVAITVGCVYRNIH